MAETDPVGSTSFGTRLRDAVSDALAYWEPRRIVYNAVLVAVVLGYFIMNWPYSRSVISFEGVLFVFILAVLANVCYCAAYVGDVFVQVSGFRQSWHKWRWVLFLVGMPREAVASRALCSATCSAVPQTSVFAISTSTRTARKAYTKSSAGNFHHANGTWAEKSQS